MLWILNAGRYEISINLAQWMIGVNWVDGGWNLFFLCFRLGRNSDELTAWLKGAR